MAGPHPLGHSWRMDFEEVVDELYGREPGDFTATRNARAQQARADGNRALADQIGKLRKPTVAAALVNRLARDEPDQVQAIVDLGAALREAQDDLDGPTLRKLSAQRQQLVGALVKQAGAGTRLSESVARELEQTFTAALADAEAADAVASGRLTAALDPAQRASWPTRTVPVRKPAEPLDEVALRREKARAEARAALERAEDTVYDAQARVETTEKARDEAQQRSNRDGARVKELEAELEQARAAAVESRKQTAAAKSDHESAERMLRGERRRLDEARQKLDKLLG